MSELADASRISRHVLADGGVTVALLNIGCVTQDWRVPRKASEVSVVLGYREPVAYLNNPHHLGVVAGRVANRISGARFLIGRREFRLDRNEGAHHLHGGQRGLGRRIWDADQDGTRAVRFNYLSPDGEMGYPGNVRFEVTVRLEGFRLSYDFKAETDRPTPINLAQHNYYNLAGCGSVREHRLRIAADRVTQVDEELIPTGQLMPIDGKQIDFRNGRTVATADPENAGLDLNYVLNRMPDQPAAQVTAPGGLRLRLWTDQPGIQLYTGGPGSQTAIPLGEQVHAPQSGFCLEPQLFPDSPNRSEFPSVIVEPGEPYRQKLTVEIAPGKACDA